MRADQILYPCLAAHPKVVKGIAELGSVQRGKYTRKLWRTKLFSQLNRPWVAAEARSWPQKSQEVELPSDPIFILGHWRSGTTHLHNLLSLHEDLAYIDYWQGFSPEACLSWHPVKSLVSLLSPRTRPMDRMSVQMDLPQEDDLLTLHQDLQSFYRVHYWPTQIREIWTWCQTAESQTAFVDSLSLAMGKALSRKCRLNFVSKSPCNTIRIAKILERWPAARFIYLYRDPKDVFASTIKTYDRVLPITSLEDYDRQELEQAALGIYREMTETLYRTVVQMRIPIMTMSYKELITGKDNIEDLCHRIGLPFTETFERKLDDYMQMHKNYRSDQYSSESHRFEQELSEINELQLRIQSMST